MASSSNEIPDQRLEDDVEQERELVMSLIIDILLKDSKILLELDLCNFEKIFKTHSVSICDLYIDAIRKKFPEANGIITIAGIAEDVARTCAIYMGFGFTSLKEPGVIQEPTVETTIPDHNGVKVTYQIKVPVCLYGRKVVIIDDILTTGSRIKAARSLCKIVGVEVVGAVVLVETEQGGRKNIHATPVVSIIDMNALNAPCCQPSSN